MSCVWIQVYKCACTALEVSCWSVWPSWPHPNTPSWTLPLLYPHHRHHLPSHSHRHPQQHRSPWTPEDSHSQVVFLLLRVWKKKVERSSTWREKNNTDVKHFWQSTNQTLSQDTFVSNQNVDHRWVKGKKIHLDDSKLYPKKVTPYRCIQIESKSRHLPNFTVCVFVVDVTKTNQLANVNSRLTPTTLQTWTSGRNHAEELT